MATMVPVEFDPFADGAAGPPTSGTAKLMPVDHDPFAQAPLPTDQHAGMSHTSSPQVTKEGAPFFDRALGGLESGLLEANKLAAQFGVWLGHPHDREDLAEAVRLQQEHEAKVREMAPSGLDAGHMLGEAVNPLNFIGPSLAVRGAGTAANALRGALGGAQGGLMTPSEGTDNLGQKARQAGFGAAGGAALGSAIPVMADQARMLVDEGVRLTPGMKVSWLRRPEEAARSLPITGQAIGAAERTAGDDFNRAIYNRILKPIGEKYDPKEPIGYDGINNLRDRLSDAYDRALTGTTFIANPAGTIPHGLTQGHLAELNNILALLTRERRDQFNAIINQFYEQRVPANRLMDGETFKRVESELSHQSRRFIKSEDPDQQALGEAIGEVADLLRDAHMVQNPAKAAELQAVNHAYRLYVTAERGAGRRTTSDGVMTPADFMAGLKAMDSSVRKNRFARGKLEMQDLARAANSVMTPHLGSSGTAERSFVIDAAKLASLGGAAAGAHYAGVPSEDIGTFLAALAAGSVPYMRLPAGLPTANLGSRLGGAIDPVLQALTPSAGSVAAQQGGGSPIPPALRGVIPGNQ